MTEEVVLIRNNDSEDRLDSNDYDTDTDRTRNDYDPAYSEDRRRERFGGTNWGSAFFGWLVAIAVAVLLVSIVGAIAAGVGTNTEVTQSDAERQAGTIGIVAAIVLLVVLMIAYYAGGYVAGRMSRFDGGRQGLAVWVIGLVVTLIAVGLGILFGSEYNILDRVDLPTMPIPTDDLTWGGVITAAAVLIGTLLAAMAGGKVGQHYHRRVDVAGYPT
ncbi:MAG TPA: hypothetical protein VFG63_04260 [Nocardioidaceae bacterium]|nr:hypothetical protein [Nocardioidaceae bacterium]